ncbi:MAG: hypothetical protein ACP6IY_10400 [Promethearchaeia archaeon]
MEKPLGILLFGILYIFLGILVVIGYIYLLITDWAIIEFTSYNAGDVVYSAKAAEIVGKYALVPSIFAGGLLAILAGFFILSNNADLKRSGYYILLIASIFWALLLIGLIVVLYFLREKPKNYLLA